MKLDFNIYGLDENAIAFGIASDALRPGKVDGGVIGPSKGSKGGGGDETVSTGDVKASHAGCGPDSRSSSKGNH